MSRDDFYRALGIEPPTSDTNDDKCDCGDPECGKKLDELELTTYLCRIIAEAVMVDPKLARLVFDAILGCVAAGADLSVMVKRHELDKIARKVLLTMLRKQLDEMEGDSQ